MPDEEIERAIERLLEGERVSRRQLLRRAGTAGIGLTSLPMLLAACGGVKGESAKGGATTAKAASGNHPKGAIDQLNFSNWPLYIDKKVRKSFERQYGGEGHYVEENHDNIAFFGKV